MISLLDAAWILVKILSYGGLAMALAGVGVFGWHFVHHNAVAAQGEDNRVPAESWRGRGARLGLMILAGGVGLQLASMLLAALVPGRH